METRGETRVPLKQQSEFSDHSPGAPTSSIDSSTHWLSYTGGDSKWVPYAKGKMLVTDTKSKQEKLTVYSIVHRTKPHFLWVKR